MIAKDVVRLNDLSVHAIGVLLGKLGLTLRVVQDDQAITASFWGETEAGLKDDILYARGDTPIHSILHEACHYVCMSDDRRRGLNTNAGGDYDEENGVCYLQVLLADQLSGFGRDRILVDMDTWDYSFRLGCARAWFETDAADARLWLVRHGVITLAQQPTWRQRQSAAMPITG